MLTKTDSIRRYVKETLGLAISPFKWQTQARLPLFLRKGYAFFEIEMLGLPCLLMADQADTSPSAAVIRKHVDQVRLKWNGEIVYVRDQLASYQRKRLIEQKVPFIVPGNQMYLPMLGIDLREHFRQLRTSSPTLSPATQAVVLQAILRDDDGVYTPADLAERLGYTKMTMTRAFNELEAGNLATITKQGRQRCLEFPGSRRDLWKRALPLLRSPVSHRRRVQSFPSPRLGQAAGLSALAHLSMLATPSIATVAISSKQWKVLQENGDCSLAAIDDPGVCEVEIWTYDPCLLSNEPMVDRLSLFLSLRDQEDERVEVAIDQMMEGVKW